MRRIDPDAMFGFVLNRWGHAVAAQVCPEADPERPAEPVKTADDPVFLAYQHAYSLRDDRDEETRQRVGLAAAIRKYDELRSSACVISSPNQPRSSSCSASSSDTHMAASGASGTNTAAQIESADRERVTISKQTILDIAQKGADCADIIRMLQRHRIEVTE